MARGALDAAGLAGLGPQGDIAIAVIPTSETFAAAAYTTATTPDRVTLQVGDPGLVVVHVDMRAKISGADATARAAVFIDGTQVNFADSADGLIKVSELAYNLTTFNRLTTLSAGNGPLGSGVASYVGADATLAAGTPLSVPGPTFFLLRPGSHVIDVRFKAAGGINWTVEQRRLLAISLA